VRIRPATADDAAAAAEVYIRARHHNVPAIPPMAHADDDVRAYFVNVLIPLRDAWVATNADDNVIAIMALDGDDVDQLYVAPEWTGRGVGTALLDLAKRERPHGLQLWAFQSNVGARRFYERHGFVAVRETDGRDNEERSPDVRYEWSTASSV
jgi:GNAT superfamily N-acetyltransferase